MNYQEIQSGTDVIVQGKNGQWIGLLIEKVERSYTKIIVMDMERGKGWNESLQKYTGVKSVGNWVRGENYGYGTEYCVHIKDVELVN